MAANPLADGGRLPLPLCFCIRISRSLWKIPLVLLPVVSLPVVAEVKVMGGMDYRLPLAVGFEVRACNACVLYIAEA